MKIKVYVSTGKLGSECKREVEIDDDDADSEDAIEEYARDAMLSMINWSWEKVEEESAPAKRKP